eukprot:scaffold349836_cov24-Prasinocladus_malaysianus.AAC.1
MPVTKSSNPALSCIVCGVLLWGVSQNEQLRALYEHRTLFVKRKAGALPYADDPTGVRSLLSRFNLLSFLNTTMVHENRQLYDWLNGVHRCDGADARRFA